MARVLVISFSLLHRDPRVHRQLRWLAASHEVTALGYSDPAIAGVRFLPVAAPTFSRGRKLRMAALLLARAHQRYYWGQPQVGAALAQLQGWRGDLVVANDVDALPLALRVAAQAGADLAAPVLLDAHEYAPLEFEDRWLWRVLFKPYKIALCRQLPEAAAMCTVAPEIARRYGQEFGVNCTVVTNAPDFQALSPSPPAADGRVRLIHHGAAIPGRQLESLVALAAHLEPRFELNLMLVPTDPAYHEQLRRMVADSPRIRWLEPVGMRDISQFINQFDLGVYLLPPTNFNNRHALPNKFFEFVQARLGMAIGPSLEMQAIVARHGLGVVAEDFQPATLARLLNGLSAAQIAGFKQAADQAALALSAEGNRAIFLGEVERLLARSGAPPCAA